MEASWVLTSTLILFGAIPCFIGAFFIGIMKRFTLISGWDQSKIREPEKYGQMIAFAVFLVGLGLCVVSALPFWITLTEMEFAMSLLVAGHVPLLLVLYASLKYKR